MVSTRDKEQQVILNPLGTVQRFHQVRFSATDNVIFGQKFDYQKLASPAARMGRSATDVPREAVEEKEASIRQRMAATKRQSRPERQPTEPTKAQQQAPQEAKRRARSQRAPQKRSAAQQEASDKRIAAQVERVNKKVPDEAPLDLEKVKEAGQARDFDKPFYSRLGRIGREATAGRMVASLYELLQNEGVKKLENGVDSTPLTGQTPQHNKSQKAPAGVIVAKTRLEKGYLLGPDLGKPRARRLSRN